MSDKDYFVVTRVHRDDLASIGYDVSNVTDETMQELADELGEAYVNDGFWIDLPIIAEHLGIPELLDKDRRCEACRRENIAGCTFCGAHKDIWE